MLVPIIQLSCRKPAFVIAYKAKVGAFVLDARANKELTPEDVTVEGFKLLSVDKKTTKRVSTSHKIFFSKKIEKNDTKTLKTVVENILKTKKGKFDL